MLLLFFLLAVLIAEPITSAELKQRYLPTLEGKIQAEEIQAGAKSDYFLGKGSVDEAFLDLDDAPLLSDSFLRTRLLVLQKEAIERERLRLQQLDVDADQSLIDLYEQRFEVYLAIQAQNQLLEERLLNALLVQLQRYPSLKEESWKEAEAFWEEQRSQVEIAADNTTWLSEINQQEQYLRQLKKAVIAFLSGSPSRLTERIAIESELSKRISSSLERKGSLERLLLISVLTEDPNVQKNIELLQATEREQELLQLRQEKESLAETWSIQEWTKEEMEATKNVLIATNKNLDLKDERDQIRLAINEQKLETIRVALNQQELEAKQLEEKLLSSQKKLSEAKKKQQESEDNNKKIQTLTVSLREDETQIRSTEAERRTTVRGFISQCTEFLQAYQEKGARALEKPPMDPERQRSIDSVYTDWHNLILSIEQEIRSNQRQSKEIRGYNAQRLPELDGLLTEYLNPVASDKELRLAISDLKSAMEERVVNIGNEELALISILVKAKVYRKEFQPYISEDVQFVTQKDFWIEVDSELREIFLMLGYRWNEFKRSLQFEEWHVEKITTYFRRLVFVSLFVLGWRLLRRRSSDILLFARKKLRNQHLNIGSFGALNLWNEQNTTPSSEEPQLLHSVIDIAMLLIGMSFFASDNLLFPFLVYVSVFVLSWRLCGPLVAALDVQDQLSRPLVNGLRLLVVCLLGVGVLDFLLADILLADRSSELLNFIQTILLWILLIYQLGVWSDLIQKYASQAIGAERLKRLMESTSSGVVGIRIRAVLGLTILSIRVLYFIFLLLMENSEFLGSTLALKTLKKTEVELEPIDKELLRDFVQNYQQEMLNQEEALEMSNVFLAWKEDKKRGLLAVIGDHGVGKSSLLNGVAKSWEQENIVHVVSLEERYISSEALISKLASTLQVSASTLNELVDALQQIPSSVICIDDVHRCMLRDVGGYDAIRALLSVMQATSQHHFWVCTFHLHAWIFLRSASTPVQLNVFRKEVHVTPLDFLEVKDWITTRCQKSNIQLNFSEISTLANKESLYRAEQAFWRLLTDLTKGNPRGIEQLWIDSMRKGTTQREVKVVLFSIPNEEILERLSDMEAFVLSYLLIHNEMTMSALQRSLNVAPASLRNASRNLIGLGLIEREQNNYEVSDEWWPLVERFLVKKRMIYLE